MKESTRVLILVVLYSVGLISIYVPALKPWCLPLTPLNLLISFLFLLQAYQWEKQLVLSALYVFILGMAAEWIGVHTGWLFGSYHYASHLGLKAGGVPLIIGVNWAMLTLLAAGVSTALSKNKGLRILFGALLMTAMDYFMEPVAINHQFWIWDNGKIPLFNYVSWFFVSLLTQWVVFKRKDVPLNNTALALFILINLFFTVQFFVLCFGGDLSFY